MTLILKYRGQALEVRAKILSYANNRNMAIMLYAQAEFGWEPFGKLTVNTGDSLAKDCALVDVNNTGEFVELVNRYRLAVPTGRHIQSGYIVYPEYQFDSQMLRELDADGYDEYLEMIAQRGDCPKEDD